MLKKLRTAAVFLVICVTIAGCATPGTGATQVSVENSRTFDAPFDKVWAAIIDGASKSDMRISAIEKASGLISFSESTYSPYQASEGTLGSTMGVPDVVMNRVGTMSFFALSTSPDKTTVKVNINMKRYVRSGNGSMAFPFVYTWQPAYSNGFLEKRILDTLADKTKS